MSRSGPPRASTRWLIAAALAALPPGCGGDAAVEGEAAAAANQEAWPTGSTGEQIERLADHIGGFSRAMMEVGYRYNELYFAGVEENWALAEYHAAKIEDAIEAGIERRPARGGSARTFLDQDLPALHEVIEARDRQAFEERFERLTQACNACHLREEMQFIEIREPERRLYPWRTP